MNDELAKEVGQESVEKLKEHIRNIINEQYASAAQQEMRNELLDVLADKVKLELSPYDLTKGRITWRAK